MDGGRCKETLEFVTENAQTVKRSENGWKGRTELKREAKQGRTEGKQGRDRDRDREG